jgi:hypothetical protein
MDGPARLMGGPARLAVNGQARERRPVNGAWLGRSGCGTGYTRIGAIGESRLCMTFCHDICDKCHP